MSCLSCQRPNSSLVTGCKSVVLASTAAGCAKLFAATVSETNKAAYRSIPALLCDAQALRPNGQPGGNEILGSCAERSMRTWPFGSSPSHHNAKLLPDGVLS